MKQSRLFSLVMFSVLAILLASQTSVHAYNFYYPGSMLNPLQIQIQPSFQDIGDRYQQTIRDQQLQWQQQDLLNAININTGTIRDTNNQIQQNAQRAKMEADTRAAQERLDASVQRMNELIHHAGVNTFSPETNSNYQCAYTSASDFASARDSAYQKLKEHADAAQFFADRDKDIFSKSIVAQVYMDAGKINVQYIDYLSKCSSIDPLLKSYGTKESSGKMVLETNQQSCQNAYGSNSKWTGQLNDRGGAVCDCLDGYLMSGGQCVAYDQSCKISYGPYSYGDAKNCYCVTGYQWASDMKSCVLIPQIAARKATFTQTLTLGSRGSEVSALQEFLKHDISLYPEGLITGIFGPATERAVQRFQMKYGIATVGTPLTTGYGLVGGRTRIKLNALQ